MCRYEYGYDYDPVETPRNRFWGTVAFVAIVATALLLVVLGICAVMSIPTEEEIAAKEHYTCEVAGVMFQGCDTSTVVVRNDNSFGVALQVVDTSGGRSSPVEARYLSAGEGYSFLSIYPSFEEIHITRSGDLVGIYDPQCP